MEKQAEQNKKTQKTLEETSMMSEEQLEVVEEQQLRRKARWLLKNFRKFLEQKHKQEEEMRNTPLFTRDVWYGGAQGWRARTDQQFV